MFSLQKKHSKVNAKLSTEIDSATILIANAAFFINIPSFLDCKKSFAVIVD